METEGLDRRVDRALMSCEKMNAGHFSVSCSLKRTHFCTVPGSSRSLPRGVEKPENRSASGCFTPANHVLLVME